MNKVTIKKDAQADLSAAVRSEDLAGVKAALAAGANADSCALGSDSYRLLHIAASNGYAQIAYALLQAGASPHHEYKYDDKIPKKMAENNGHVAIAEILNFFENGAKTWEKTGEREIRKTRVMDGGKIVLVDVFNFEDKICVSATMRHGSATVVLREHFKALPQEAVRQAAAELKNQGGEPGTLVMANDIKPRNGL